MDENLASTLQTYFNVTLSHTLGYSSRFFKPTYLQEEGTIFLKRENWSRDFDMMIRYNPYVVTKLKQELLDLLNSYFGNLTDISLTFNESGFVITLISDIQMGLNIDIYVNLLKQLHTVEDVDNFCRSSKETMLACRSKRLWRMLFTSIYDFPYKHQYNYEKLYKEYLIYKSYGVNEGLYPNITDKRQFRSIKNLLNFLIKEDVIRPENYGIFIWPIIYTGDKESWVKIFNYYINNEDKIKILLEKLTLIHGKRGNELKTILQELDSETLNNLFELSSLGDIQKSISPTYNLIARLLFDLSSMFGGISPFDLIERLGSHKADPIGYFISVLYDLSRIGGVQYKQFADRIKR